MKNDLKSKIACFLEDRSGAVTATAAIWLSLAGIGLIGLSIDGANLYRVKDALQQSSNRAAMAGAEQLSVSSQAVAISTAKTYSSDSATPGLNGIGAVQSVTATVAASCIWSLLPGDPISATACPGISGANVITVTQTATVNTFFGFGSKTVTASAAATANGANGYTGNLDVVIILDTTASMAQCENGTNGCSGHTFATPISCPAPAPSWASTSSKMQAAELAVQTLLCNFTPASGTAGTQVALMTFPGVSNPSVEYCGTNGSPTTVPYNKVTNAQYLIVPFSNTYRTSAQATALNQNDNLVKAMGGNASCAGMQDPGGQSTYYGGAVSAAQAYLTANGRSTAQKVIFLLSDGDAQASSGPANQCQTAVTNAQTAAAAGTWVFSIAYDSLTSGTCSKDSGTYSGNACKAMQNIASSKGTTPDSTKFFAYNGAGSGANCTSNNVSLPTLAATFKAALQSMTPARMVTMACATSEGCRQ